jgi:hypothetical protein
MPRIRTIKPEFFSNEEIGNLPPEARLLFVGLWTLADREGRLQDRPMRIGAQLFPYDDWSIGALLQQLDQAGLILRYELYGKKCIQIINFTKHQNPHPKETNYGLPPPVKHFTEITGNSTEVTEIQPPCPVDSHVLSMGNGPIDYGLSPPTPSQQESAETAPAERPRETKTSERESKSRFSLKECEQYAASLKGIKQPKAYGKTIWRSAEADDEIAEFQGSLGNTGKLMKKQPDKPVDVAAMQRLADELEKMELKEQAAAVRAGIEASK